MRWLDKLERHFGFLAIPNLILAVIIGQIASTLMGLKDPSIGMLLMLDPAAVAAGQWWRLLTWVIVPSLSPLNLIMAVFWFQFLFSIGQALEQSFGTFKSTAYLLLGVGLPSLGAMLLWHFAGADIILSGFYFSTSLLLAYAALAPDQQILIMFILPVKMRWVAIFLGALLVWNGFSQGWPGLVEALFGAGNYLIFFLPAGIQAWRQRRYAAVGQRVFREAKREAEKAVQRVCAECGRGPEADLRLCTCELCGLDGRNWCAEHLKPHLAETNKKRKS